MSWSKNVPWPTRVPIQPFRCFDSDRRPLTLSGSSVHKRRLSAGFLVQLNDNQEYTPLWSNPRQSDCWSCSSPSPWSPWLPTGWWRWSRPAWVCWPEGTPQRSHLIGKSENWGLSLTIQDQHLNFPPWWNWHSRIAFLHLPLLFPGPDWRYGEEASLYSIVVQTFIQDQLIEFHVLNQDIQVVRKQNLSTVYIYNCHLHPGLDFGDESLRLIVGLNCRNLIFG